MTLSGHLTSNAKRYYNSQPGKGILLSLQNASNLWAPLSNENNVITTNDQRVEYLNPMQHINNVRIPTTL